jgi:endogenous inhibitor of DNA gyrase (YacG/DUF329 family)
MEPSQKEKCPQCGKDIVSPFTKKIIYQAFDFVSRKEVVKEENIVFCSMRCASHHQMALEG